MTIEDLLKQLETEREELAIEYRNYYDKAVEAKKGIARIRGNPFASPDEIPFDLIENYSNYSDLHTVTVHKHNRILDAINVIKERVGK